MQKSILMFSSNTIDNCVSNVSQKEHGSYSHTYYDGATDFNGNGSHDKFYLRAPFDCKVKAIGPYDNTIFFESLDYVDTPSGVKKVWFMCAHMDDNDFNEIGFKIGKIFEQGDICYREGKKGNASGWHIHIESGEGEFDRTQNAPYYKTAKGYFPCSTMPEEVITNQFYVYELPAVGNFYESYDWTIIDEESQLEKAIFYLFKAQDLIEEYLEYVHQSK